MLLISYLNTFSDIKIQFKEYLKVLDYKAQEILIMREYILFILGVLFVIQLEGVIGAKPRFAPKYCLRFKFDCTSPEKKNHVCCLFPLPIEGNELEAKSTAPDTGMTI